ncbi:MAG: HEAT repeat domain-containing protein [Firmicutes bacterium]|nr:HEAT repeat domain-containing protein [Bacillota bacterium]
MPRTTTASLAALTRCIASYGESGQEASKSELHSARQSDQRNNWAIMLATNVLWSIGGIEEAPLIAEIWNEIPILRYDSLVGGLGHDTTLQVSGSYGPRSVPVKAVYAYALGEYGDLRAVPHLAALLDSPDDSVWSRALVALVQLLSVESLDIIESHAASEDSGSELAEQCRQALALVSSTFDPIVGGPFLELPDDEQRDVLRDLFSSPFVQETESAPLTRDEYLSMLDEWERCCSITQSNYQWPGLSRMAHAADVSDLDRLRDIRASFF